MWWKYINSRWAKYIIERSAFTCFVRIMSLISWVFLVIMLLYSIRYGILIILFSKDIFIFLYTTFILVSWFRFISIYFNRIIIDQETRTISYRYFLKKRTFKFDNILWYSVDSFDHHFIPIFHKLNMRFILNNKHICEVCLYETILKKNIIYDEITDEINNLLIDEKYCKMPSLWYFYK